MYDRELVLEILRQIQKATRTISNTLYQNEGPLPFIQSLKTFTAMWNHGMKLGVLPPKDPLEGIETDIKIAGVLNSCLKSSFQK
ncbi:MAG: hypothetical protein R6W88_08545 [Desulfobacterales bacterium]